MSFEEISKAIDRMFGDLSVSRATTRERLEEIIDQCETMLAALDDDED